MQCLGCGAAADPGVVVCPRCGRGLDARLTHLIGAGDAETGESPPLVLDETVIASPAGAIGSATPRVVRSAQAAGKPAGLPPAGTRASASRETGGLEPGENFGGRYHVIRLLGMGGMGAVYQVWDSDLEVALALKVVRPDAIEDPAAAAQVERRFKRELLLARKVTHPNVVRIHDMGDVEGVRYITMPYVEGTDLARILSERGTLPVREALEIARQVAAGLGAAHEAGVIHRDLKPANIMIDAERRALIMDFGIAHGSTSADLAGATGRLSPDVHSGATQLGSVVGTIEYMAPEQARGAAVDHRADVYALGLILSRLLVGVRLMPGATDALSDLSARMAAPPPPVREFDPSIPAAVEAIVSRCLQPDPADRYQTTAELSAALNALDDEGTPLPAPRHKTTWRFKASAAAIVLAIVLATWFVTSSLRSRSDAGSAPRDPIAILVADAANGTGEPVFDGMLEQALTLAVEGASFVSAYQRPAALRIARQLDAGDRLEPSAARLVAVREGIKMVVVSSIESQGSGYALSARGIDPSSGTELSSVRAQARTRDQVLAAAGTLGARFRSTLGDTRAPDPAETFSSSSLDAVAAYTRAQELSSAGKDQDAIVHFKEAIERDPAFGRAYGGWAMSLTRLGRREEAEAKWKEALARVERMTPRERYRLEGAYSTLVTRNYGAAIDKYSSLVKEYPADGAGHNNLAVMLFRNLDFDQAMEEGRRVLAIYPSSPLYRTNVALYAMYAGDFATAAKQAQEVVDQKLATYDTYLPLAVSAVASGRRDAARAAYGEMAAVDAAGESLAQIALADLALSEGDPAKAVELLRAGIAVDRERDNPAAVALKQVALADALGMQREFGQAAAAARAALAIDKSEAQIVPAVRWLLEAGAVEEAARVGAELDGRLEAQPRAYGRVVAAQIALRGGRRVEAVDALREALKLADLWIARFYLGRAYLEAGYFAEALSEFELCLKRRGEGYAMFLDDVPTTRYVAPLPYWIGRAHEGLGLADQARGDYQTFVDARAADAADSLAIDARRRLGQRR
jgi:serine/threonine protein kinase/tetratricopeptide (TPR) repeat protein